MRRSWWLGLLLLACAPERASISGFQPTDAGQAGRDASVGDPDGGSLDGGSPGMTPVGGPCLSDADCRAIGGGAKCLTEATAAEWGVSAPGGYCTSQTCNGGSPAASCGLATVCGPLSPSMSSLHCQAACSQPNDCRDGYGCVNGGCVPEPLPDPVDGGTTQIDAGPSDAGSMEMDAGPSEPADAGPPPPCSEHDGVWVFEAAPCFNHSIGRADADGWSATVGVDHPDLMLWGPYVTTIPGGSHRVSFTMLIDDITYDNARVLTADVNDATDGRILVAGQLTRMNFHAPWVYEGFYMDFTSIAGHKLEFRLGWTNRAYVRVQQVVVQ